MPETWILESEKHSQLFILETSRSIPEFAICDSSDSSELPKLNISNKNIHDEAKNVQMMFPELMVR